MAKGGQNLYEIHTHEFLSILFLDGWEGYSFNYLQSRLNWDISVFNNGLLLEIIQRTFPSVDRAHYLDYIRILKGCCHLGLHEKPGDLGVWRNWVPEKQACVIAPNAICCLSLSLMFN